MKSYRLEVIKRINILVIRTVVIDLILFCDDSSGWFYVNEDTENTEESEEEDNVCRNFVSKKNQWLVEQILPNHVRGFRNFAKQLQVFIQNVDIFIGIILFQITEIIQMWVPVLFSSLLAFLCFELHKCCHRSFELLLVPVDFVQDNHFLLHDFFEFPLKHKFSSLFKSIDQTLIVISKEDGGHFAFFCFHDVAFAFNFKNIFVEDRW